MKRLLLAFIFLIGIVPACSAQYAYNCPTYDTIAFDASLSGVAVIADCQINTGVTGAVLAVATGTITCGANSDYAATMFATSLTYSLGANFNGSLVGTTLTVSNMITPTQFTIQSGQFLYDNLSGAGIPLNNGGSTVSVTGQLTSTEPDGALGLRGTYSVSTAATVSSELMWALTKAGPLPSKAQIAHGPVEQLACRNGTSQLVTIVGAVPAAAFIPNFNLHIILTISAENIGGMNPQSASFKNGQISVISLGNKVGGKGQLVQ